MKLHTRLGAVLALLLLPLFSIAQTKSGPLLITGSGCVSVSVDGQAQIAINVSGGSWSGTIQPKASIAGQAVANVQVTPSTSSTAQSTITANGLFTATVAGYQQFFLCGNTVTGTATIYTITTTRSAAGRNSGSGGAPGGAAGGDLGGTYPNPTVLSVANVNTGAPLGITHGGTSATAEPYALRVPACTLYNQAPVTGTGAQATLATCTIPHTLFTTGSVPSNGRIHCESTIKRTTGTTTTGTFSWQVAGGTNMISSAIGSGTAYTEALAVDSQATNQTGVYSIFQPTLGTASGNVAAASPVTTGSLNLATLDVIVTLGFNFAATDAVTVQKMECVVSP